MVAGLIPALGPSFFSSPPLTNSYIGEMIIRTCML